LNIVDTQLYAVQLSAGICWERASIIGWGRAGICWERARIGWLRASICWERAGICWERASAV